MTSAASFAGIGLLALLFFGHPPPPPSLFLSLSLCAHRQPQRTPGTRTVSPCNAVALPHHARQPGLSASRHSHPISRIPRGEALPAFSFRIPRCYLCHDIWNTPSYLYGRSTPPGRLAHRLLLHRCTDCGSRPGYVSLSVVPRSQDLMCCPPFIYFYLLLRCPCCSSWNTTHIVCALRPSAYLTNPSETSFRTYLTEQSFRQHLSRLDDNAQDEQSSTKGSALLLAASRRSPPISHNRPRPDFSTKSPFHFVNRASISLRTPKHVIHSFGILTIAAVLPSGSQPRGALPVEGLPSTVNDSWFIGAFGKWWRGGPIRTWFHDVIVNTKDAERMSSGILDAKALDNLECYDGV